MPYASELPNLLDPHVGWGFPMEHFEFVVLLRENDSSELAFCRRIIPRLFAPDESPH